ncbi:MAG: hypothetical protein ACW99G_24180 [Candidatus Thorarchaeota archaeon]|jgi:hypothetical protein
MARLVVKYRLRYDSGIDPFYYSGEVEHKEGTAKILKMPDGSQITITLECGWEE